MNYHVTIKSIVSVDYTADEWQLFTASMDCEDAAMALNEAASEALSCGNYSRAWEIWNKAATKWQNWGAADSEPRYEFELLTRRVFGEDGN